MKNIFFDELELKKAKYVTELFEIHNKEDNFLEFVSKLKDYSHDNFYSKFKNSDKIKTIYVKKNDFKIFLCELSSELFQLNFIVNDDELVFKICNKIKLNINCLYNSSILFFFE